MLYNTYVYIRPERFFLSTQKCNSLYRHGHSSVWIPGTSGCCERAWTTTTRLSLLHNKMQTLNSSKSSVLYQLEFQIMLSKVYIQTPLVRGMYLASLQGRTEGSVSQVGCGTSWRVTRGCRSQRVPAWLNGSACPHHLPLELIPGEQEGPCVITGFSQALTNEKCLTGHLVGFVCFEIWHEYIWNNKKKVKNTLKQK